MRIPLLILALLLSCSAWAQTVIHAGKLVDAVAGEVIEAVTIVVDGDRITSVQLGYVGEPDIDLTGAFVMPGWIDMHVHISSQQSPDRFVENFTLEPRGLRIAGGTLRGADADGGIHHRTRSRHRPRTGPIHPPGGRRRPHRRAAHLHLRQESRHHRRTRRSHQRSQQRIARRSGGRRKASSTVWTMPTRPCAPGTRRAWT